MSKVENAMHFTIRRMEEMFSKKLIHAGNVTAQACTVKIQDSYNGESGSYNLDVNNCIIEANLYPESDYAVLRHEMFHALSNGFFRGKSDSMPRMFVEGWADVAGATNHGSNQDALINIAVLNQNTLNSLSNLFDALGPFHMGNYVLGMQYFYFCMHTSPDTLLRYVNKIKLSPFQSSLNHNAMYLHGIPSLEQQCSLADFISWLQYPDYTIQDPNLTIEDLNLYYDIILACDNGMNKVLRCKQQSKIHIPKNISSQSCPIAHSDITPFAKDRVIFSHSQGIVVITNELGDQGFTVLHVGANIEKRFCAVTDLWVYNKILDFQQNNMCTDTIQNEIVNFVKQCSSQLPTAEDIGIFPVTTKATTNTDDANQDIILICDPEQGSSSYICPAPRQQIPTLEQYIKYNCSSAIGDNLTNRIISYHNFNDIKVITFQNSGVEFITRQYNIFEKYFCDSHLRNWFEQSVKQIIHNKGSNCKSIIRDIDMIEEIPITKCQKVSLSTSDMLLLSQFIHDNNIEDSATGSTNISLPLLYVVGILGIGVGIGVGVWMCKNTQSKNLQPIAHELTVLSSNQSTDMDPEAMLAMNHTRNLENQNELYYMLHEQLNQYNVYKHTYQKLQLQSEINADKLAQNEALYGIIIKAQDNNITPNVDLNGDANDHYDSDFS